MVEWCHGEDGENNLSGEATQTLPAFTLRFGKLTM